MGGHGKAVPSAVREAEGHRFGGLHLGGCGGAQQEGGRGTKRAVPGVWHRAGAERRRTRWLTSIRCYFHFRFTLGLWI